MFAFSVLRFFLVNISQQLSPKKDNGGSRDLQTGALAVFFLWLKLNVFALISFYV